MTLDKMVWYSADKKRSLLIIRDTNKDSPPWETYCRYERIEEKEDEE